MLMHGQQKLTIFAHQRYLLVNIRGRGGSCSPPCDKSTKMLPIPARLTFSTIEESS